MRSNKLLLVPAVLAAVVFAVVTAASGRAANVVRVNALACAGAGGLATVPAGSEVEVALANILKNRGLTTDFLRMERTTIAIDGGALINISKLWSAPAPAPFPGFEGDWFTRVLYDTGVVLAQGQSMKFEFVLAEPHLYLDDLTFVNGVSGQPVRFPPNVYTYDCTVTAV